MYSRNLTLEKLQLAALDGLVVFGSLLLAVWLRHGWGLFSPSGPSATPWSGYLFPALLAAGVFVLLLRYHGLYSGYRRQFSEALAIFKVASLGTMIVLTLTFFYRGYSYSRVSVVLFYPLTIVSLVAARRLYRVYHRAVLTHRAAQRRVLIIGFGRVGQHLGAAILDHPSYYALVGFVDDDPRKRGQALGGAAVLGDTRDLAGLVREHGVDEIIVACPSAAQQRIMELVGECMRLRVGWKVVPNLCDLMLDRVHLDLVGGLPLLALRGSNILGFNWVLKRAFDAVFSALILVVLAPLLLLIALAVKLTSKGPVLFRQSRIGLRGRTFMFLKFRSMRVGQDGTIHRDFTRDWIHGRTGPVQPASLGAAAAHVLADPERAHKITHDPRVTAIGRILRRTSLDELPQFWNVLRGEMSVVGPRPAIPYEVERYTEWHKRRLDVLPGITGLWQVSGRNALSFEEMVHLDIQYIETWSIEQDVRIVLKTVPALLLGRAY